MLEMTTDKAIDLMDSAAKILKQLDMKKIAKITKENKDENERGIAVMLYFGENLKKIKEPLFELVATYSDKKVDEVKKQPIGETWEIVKGIFTDKEVVSFFKQAMQ